eukprot:3506939-Amphidinium_carterae.1
MVPQGDWDYLQKAGFPISEVIARLQFFGMTLYRGGAAARQGETTDTSSTSEQKPVSFGSAVSRVTTPAAEEKSTPSPLSCMDAIYVAAKKEDLVALCVTRQLAVNTSE